MMDRRQFVGSTLVGGAGLAVGAGCAPTDGGDGRGSAWGAVGPFELDELGVAELQRSMDAGERTARSITEAYLERIEELNLRGPELRAIIETNPDALRIADELDEERRTDGPRGGAARNSGRRQRQHRHERPDDALRSSFRGSARLARSCSGRPT